MNKLKTAMLVSGAVVTAGSVGLGTVTTASATTKDSSKQTYQSDHSTKWQWGERYDAALADAFASKFNLDKTEVKDLIKQVREQQTQKHQAQKYTTLQKALSDGKLTQEQYDHITAVWKEVDTLRDSLKDKSKSERADVIKDIRTKLQDLNTWMKDQKLSWKELGFDYGDSGRHHQHHGGWHHGHKDNR